jgi:transketolase
MGTIDATTDARPNVITSTSDVANQLCVNAIRTLARPGFNLFDYDVYALCGDGCMMEGISGEAAMDAVQAAKSGHPGTPMALAPVVYCLWQRVLRFDPSHPIWPNRDRFVLSAGHASMLLYAILHLTGVKAVNPKYETLGQLSVTLEDIKRFRQLNSKCPGHPEYRWTSGVETTTGTWDKGWRRASAWRSPSAGWPATPIAYHHRGQHGAGVQ